MFFFPFRRIQTKREQSNIIISFIISHFISRSIYSLFHSCILKSDLGSQYHLTKGTVSNWSKYSILLTQWYCLNKGKSNSVSLTRWYCLKEGKSNSVLLTRRYCLTKGIISSWPNLNSSRDLAQHNTHIQVGVWPNKILISSWDLAQHNTYHCQSAVLYQLYRLYKEN